MENKKGEIFDLLEKIEKGALSPEEVIKVLKTRHLTERDIMKGWGFSYILYFTLCYLPGILIKAAPVTFNFLLRLPIFNFPHWVTYICSVLFLVSFFITLAGIRSNIKNGGLNSENDTLFLMKKGIYGLVRHPSSLAWAFMEAALPIMLNSVLPFTLLSIFGVLFMFIVHYISTILEEKRLDIPKWGKAYRQYMQEVPRLNILLGIYRKLSMKKEK